MTDLVKRLRDIWRFGIYRVKDPHIVAKEAADALEEKDAEIARLRKYARHDNDCACMDRMDAGGLFERHDWPCSCGLLKALADTESNGGRERRSLLPPRDWTESSDE